MNENYELKPVDSSHVQLEVKWHFVSKLTTQDQTRVSQKKCKQIKKWVIQEHGWYKLKAHRLR